MAASSTLEVLLKSPASREFTCPVRIDVSVNRPVESWVCPSREAAMDPTPNPTCWFWLTLGPSWAHPDFKTGDPYHNVVAGFQIWWVSALYIVANIFLGLHLYHGLWSMFRSLGWNRPGVDKPTRRFAQVFSWVVTLGNLSFPLAVLAGVVR